MILVNGLMRVEERRSERCLHNRLDERDGVEDRGSERCLHNRLDERDGRLI